LLPQLACVEALGDRFEGSSPFWWRLSGIVVLSLVTAPLAVAVVHAIGPLAGHFLRLTCVCLPLCLTVGAVPVGLQSALGVIGTGVSILPFVVLGNPPSGGA
jgi:hypothetical protein